jgi:ABC-type Zn uptake system ZnuABC Zn-binding protein ZnuA
VYTEQGVSSGPVQVVAGLTGVPVKTLDPLEEAPLSGTAKTNSYFAVMEDDLDALEGGLACDGTELFS